MDSEPPQPGIGSRYALLVFIWSTTPLAVVLSIRELNPVWALALRFAFAAPLAWLCLRLMGERLPLHRAARRSYLAGSLSLIGAMLFTYLGAATLPSALISLLFGTSPLLMGLLAHVVFRTQLLRAEQWVGLVLAFAGLLVIFSQGQQGAAHTRGVILTLMGMACYAVSVFWLKRENAGLHPMAQTTGSLALSGVGMLAVLPFYADAAPRAMPGAVTLAALAWSVIMASVVAMLCYFFLVQNLPPATISLTTILTPVLALVWGAWLNHERFTAATGVGMAVILAGLGAYFVRELWPARRLAA